MEVANQNLGKIYAARAMADSSNLTKQVYTSKDRETRDMVYNGTNNSTFGNVTSINNEDLRKNKKHNRTSISPFTIILLLLGAAVASVLYIGNILSVGQLMVENNVRDEVTIDLSLSKYDFNADWYQWTTSVKIRTSLKALQIFCNQLSMFFK